MTVRERCVTCKKMLATSVLSVLPESTKRIASHEREARTQHLIRGLSSREGVVRSEGGCEASSINNEASQGCLMRFPAK